MAIRPGVIGLEAHAFDVAPSQKGKRAHIHNAVSIPQAAAKDLFGKVYFWCCLGSILQGRKFCVIMSGSLNPTPSVTDDSDYSDPIL